MTALPVPDQPQARAPAARARPPSTAELLADYAQAAVFPSAREIPQAVRDSVTRVGVVPYVKLLPKIPSLEATLNPSPHFADALCSSPSSDDEDPMSLATARSAAAVAAEAAGGYPIHEVELFKGACREILAAAESTLWFAVSVDRRNGDLSDCGGRRERAEAIEETAARELYEESVRLFDFRAGDAFVRLCTEAPVVTNGAIAVFFARVAPAVRFGFPDDLATTFANARETLPDCDGAAFRENSLMYWAPASDLARVVAVRTRLSPPCSVHYSPIHVPRWLRGTRNEIQALARHSARNNARTIDGSAAPVNHPLLYESIRRALFPTWSDLTRHLESWRT